MKSLHLRIMLIFSIIIVTAGSLLSYQIYTSSVDLITRSLGEQARSVADHAVKQIDRGLYRKLAEEQAENAYYKELRQTFNAMREANHLKYLYTMAERKNGTSSEYVYIVDGMPLDAQGEDVSPLGKVEPEVDEALRKAFGERQVQVGELTKDEAYGAVVTAYVPITTPEGELLGVLGADLDATSVYELLGANQRKVLLMAGGILLASLAAIYAVSRMIVAPVLRLTREMERVQAGDLTVTMQVRGRDEVSRLAETFQRLVHVLKDMIQGVQISVQDMRQATVLLAENADATSASSERIAGHLSDSAADSRIQAQYTGETARAINEVGEGVLRIADSLAVVAEASQQATGAAKIGEGYIHQAAEQIASVQSSARETSQDVERLRQRTEEVSQIADMMRGIASQTSLLALNAAIEAARAGEHGLGFNVVAGQVRKLAVQSEESALRIGELIDAMVEDTGKVVLGVHQQSREVDSGLSIIRSAGHAFGRILHEVERVASQVQGLSSTTGEIAAGAEQVTSSADEMERLSRQSAEHGQGIASAADKQLEAMRQLADLSGKLEEMSGRMERLIGRFTVSEEPESSPGGKE
ncbi:methyl-accepting chemotaxis protein [Paenibacillus puerhi]|uniref:methyl-accepting chemotaxis protein n=1 Tax=Paenibacillus puerhi TaxID=2692622 RepID=UPI00135ABA9A|nr:methyl-accepting chemotaxis protein [Paenibacillus puerhi]